MGKKKSSKHQRRLPDKERWYKLEAVFDDQDYVATPIKGAWFRGALDKVILVEVNEEFPQDQYGPLASWLESKGIDAMVVKDTVRFLKIAPASKAESALLDTHYEKAEAKRQADAEAAEAAAEAEAKAEPEVPAEEPPEPEATPAGAEA